jgi:hypothetical protein
MVDPTTTPAWMTHAARRMSSSSGLPLAPSKAAPCVLDLLGRVCPQADAAVEPTI